MVAKTRLGYGGYGIERAGSFAGKAGGGGGGSGHPVGKITCLGMGGYGVQRGGPYSGKSSGGGGGGGPHPVGKITRLGYGGYGIQRGGPYSGKTPGGSSPAAAITEHGRRVFGTSIFFTEDGRYVYRIGSTAIGLTEDGRLVFFPSGGAGGGGGPHPVAKITRFGLDGYGVRRYKAFAFAGKHGSGGGGGPTLHPHPTGYPPVPEFMPDDKEHRRQIARRINSLSQGKLNVTIQVTLRPSLTTTPVTDARIGKTSLVVPAMALSPDGAAAIAAGVWVSNILSGSCTINHASNAAIDQTILFLIIG